MSADAKRLRHSHKCAECARVWSHREDALTAMDPHQHMCPGCGEEQWEKYVSPRRLRNYARSLASQFLVRAVESGSATGQHPEIGKALDEEILRIAARLRPRGTEDT